MFDFRPFRAVTFDCYGTLIDWESGIVDHVQPWLAEIGSPVPPALVVTAFALIQAKHQQIRPTLLYPEVLRRTWREIEATFGWDEVPAHAEAFAAAVPTWPPFPDTVAALRYLSRFFQLGILSNVDNASLRATLQHLEVPFALTVTAEDVGSYKPGLPHFETALARLDVLGVPRDRVLHVAQSKHHDIAPSRQIGLTCVWVNRRQGKRGSGATLATEAEPDLTVATLAELVALHEAWRRGG